MTTKAATMSVSMLNTINFLSCVIHTLFVANSAASTTCSVSVSPAQEGQPTSITCHFPDDVSVNKTSVNLMRYSQGTPPVLVLSYIWASKQSAEPSIATFENGYVLSGAVGRQMRILIDDTALHHTGNYSCDVLNPQSQEQSTCTLEIAEKGSVTSCSVPSVAIGETTRLTCQFNKSILQSNTEVVLLKGLLSEDNGELSTVVDCVQPSGPGNIDCSSHVNGYTVDTSQVTDFTLTVTFGSVTQTSEGVYVCKIISSLAPEQENKCYFKLSGSKLGDNTDDSEIKLEILIGSIFAGIFFIVLIVVAVVILIKCRRRGNNYVPSTKKKKTTNGEVAIDSEIPNVSYDVQRERIIMHGATAGSFQTPSRSDSSIYTVASDKPFLQRSGIPNTSFEAQGEHKIITGATVGSLQTSSASDANSIYPVAGYTTSPQSNTGTRSSIASTGTDSIVVGTSARTYTSGGNRDYLPCASAPPLGLVTPYNTRSQHSQYTIRGNRDLSPYVSAPPLQLRPPYNTSTPLSQETIREESGYHAPQTETTYC